MKGYSKLMKKALVKILALSLSLLLCLGVICGCASSGKKFMTLDGESMSVNMFQLYLSRMKGTLASSYAYGSTALTNSFWDTVMDGDGTTYNDYFTAQILENTKTYLAALALFDEEGLKLPDEYVDEIDSEMERLLEEEADGSKNAFNAILAPYGVNYKMLREAYIIEAKIAYLNDHLFGEGGSKIAPTLLEDYYQENYVRFKQVFIYTYALVYETDEFENDIYYSVADPTRISYDTKATQKKNDDDTVARDKNNDIIYVNEKGEIAYDKANGERVPKLDADGNQLTREYTKDELIEASDRAQLIFESTQEKNYTLFDSLVESYSEDEGMTEYKNGYYMTKDTEYEAPEVLEELFDMNDGEIRMVHSEYGIHIVMKYALDEGGYSLAENKMFFRDSDGKYTFLETLKNQLLAEKLQPYKDRIEIDDGLIEGIDMKSVEANFYY